MKNVIKSPAGRYFSFDTGSGAFEFGGGGVEKSVALGEFLRFSESRPWNFPVRTYENVRVAVTPDEEPMLIAAVENEEFLCGLAFNFDGELLKGDLFLSVKKDLPYHFAALALPVENASQLTLPGVLYSDNPSAAPEHLASIFAC